jgi:hypothetical protein
MNFKLSDKAYNILKWMALVFLPAAGTLYGTLSDIWGIPFGDEIARTVVAVEFFLGAILGISTIQYKKNK